MALTHDDLQANSGMMKNELENTDSSMKNEFKKTEGNMASMNNLINSIKLTLENEINPNLKMIADGYRDLSRKLDDALKIKKEREILLNRLIHLENEMRIVKERLKEIK
jgi:translation initiation factor 2B subunit (eIF-2B alpha/beta/delta family)